MGKQIFLIKNEQLVKNIINIWSLFILIQLELYRIGSDQTNTAVTYSPIQLWPAMVEQLVEHEC
jgi:hypothetical protein